MTVKMEGLEVLGGVPLGIKGGNPVVFHEDSQEILELSGSKPSMLRLGDRCLTALGGRRTNDKGKDLGPDWEKAYLRLQEICQKKGTFFMERLRGPGLWLEDGKPFFHDGKKFVKTDKHMYVSDPRGFVEPEPGNLLECAQIFYIQIYQAYGKETATALLGFIVSALAGGAISWRFHLWLSGPRGTGKSTIWGILREIFGGYAIALDGKSSAAGIRQQIRASTRPVLLDESEPQEMRGEGKGILALSRASSSGSEMFLGTPDGKGVSYVLHSSFCFGSINPPDLSAADASRFHIVNLERRRGGKRPAFRKNFLCHLGRTILWHLIQNLDRFREAVEGAKVLALVGEEERLQDTIGTLIGATNFAFADGKPGPVGCPLTIEFSKEVFQVDDAKIILEKLLQAQIRPGLSLTQAVLSEDDDEKKQAEAFNVKIVVSEKNGTFLFIPARNESLKKMTGLSGRFQHVIKRLPGVLDNQVAKFGKVSVKGIGVPIEICDFDLSMDTKEKDREKKLTEEERVPF